MATMGLSAMILALIICKCSSLGHFDKALNSHSAVLDHFKPKVAEFAKSLASQLEGSEGLQVELNDVINKNLAAQLDKLAVMHNETSTIDMCCKCKRCSRPCTACGQSCCCKGDQGCSCKSCSKCADMKLENIGADSSSLVQMWAESSKQLVKRDVMRVAARGTSANDRCCSCDVCDQYQEACGVAGCCVRGQNCMCRKCSSKQIDLVADYIINPITLTPRAVDSVNQVDFIIDSLLAVLSFP